MEFSVELGLESNSDRAPPKQLPSLRFKTVHKNKKMVGSPSVMQPKGMWEGLDVGIETSQTAPRKKSAENPRKL